MGYHTNNLLAFQCLSILSYQGFARHARKLLRTTEIYQQNGVSGRNAAAVYRSESGANFYKLCRGRDAAGMKLL